MEVHSPLRRKDQKLRKRVHSQRIDWYVCGAKQRSTRADAGFLPLGMADRGDGDKGVYLHKTCQVRGVSVI